MINKQIKYRLIILLAVLILPSYNSYTIGSLKSIIDYSNDELNNDVAYKIINQGQIEYLKYKISPLNIAPLNQKELLILKNILFAQYGYKFKSQELFDYFKKFYWYKPIDFNDKQIMDILFTEVDKSNLEIIQSFENINKSRNDVVTKEKLVGVWHSVFPMPAGFADRYIFYPDGKFIYIYSTMRQLPKIYSISGTYKINGNCLELTTTEREIYTNIDDIGFAGGPGYYYKSASRKIEKIIKPKIYNLPITNPEIVNLKGIDYQLEKIYIGTWFFYHYSKTPKID